MVHSKLAHAWALAAALLIAGAAEAQTKPFRADSGIQAATQSGWNGSNGVPGLYYKLSSGWWARNPDNSETGPLGAGGGSTGNWTFSGNNTDLSGAGTMGVCVGATLTACTLGKTNTPTTINSTINLFRSGTSDGASAVLMAGDTTAAWSNATAKLLSLRTNAVEKWFWTPGGNMGMPANSIFTGASAAIGTIGMSLQPAVADGASSVAVEVNNLATLSNATADLLRLRNNGTTLLHFRLNSSDGMTLVDGGGVAKLALSTNVGAVFGYSSATFSAGSGSVTMTDGTGSIGISAGNLTLTIIQGVPDADGTRDWGTLSTRWRIGGFKRLVQGEQSMAFSATPAFDCTAGNAIHIGTITGNITGPTMVSGSAGEQCTIVFQKDGTASAYTITASWGSNVRATASTFTTGAGSLVILHFFWDANLTTPAWVLTSGLAYN